MGRIKSGFLISLFIADTAVCFVQRPQQQNSRFTTRVWSTWQSHVSTHPVAMSALEKVLGELVPTNDEKNITFLFVGQSHEDDFEEIAQAAFPKIGGRMVAVLGAGVIGERMELDTPGQPCLSILTGKLPDGAHVDFFQGKSELVKSFKQEKDHSYLLLADPFSDGLEDVLSEVPPQTIMVGGISCPTSDQRSSLALDGNVLEKGTMLAVQFSGTIGFQTIVAQGCRPIFGEQYIVTEVMNNNIITKLNDQPALKVLHGSLTSLPPEEQGKLSGGLLCGLCSQPQENGVDFLCRQLAGFAPEVGGFAIGASTVKEGDALIFQVRDKVTAEQDLQLMVQRAKTTRLFNAGQHKSKILATLQISCVARGRGLFEVPNVDLTQIQELLENEPVAGFYANGEIGPIGLAGFTKGSDDNEHPSFLHGFTTVAAILCEYPLVDDDKTRNEDALSVDENDAWA
mmetsp:Transcript_29430/g.44906  ORF Transcript_29430/g.44906 Transcript_29430/m.44906 type:complete len:456 (+) Transcript_29430:115-1482(+)